MSIIFPRVLNMRILLTYCVLLLMVQHSNGIAVEGNVSVQRGLAEGVVIYKFVDGRRIDMHRVETCGKYKIELKFNHKYELIFSQKGYFPQKIVIETFVSDGIMQSNPQFPPFPIDINLFTEIQVINKSFTEKAIRKIYYNQNLNNFISEVYFDDIQIAKQIEQAVFQAQLISSETEFLSKLTRIELAEMKREYDKIIDRAGKVYDKGSVLAALDGYKSSGNVFTREKFPKATSNEIYDLLGSILIAAELDKEQTEKFDVFTEEADILLDQKKYASARVFYNRALSIKPDDGYAKQQSELIYDLLKIKIEDERYKNIIAKADNSFMELLYNEAAENYHEALKIKPNEPYPKTKLEKIESILEKESKEAEKKESYNLAMKHGENMYQKQFYEKSLASCVNALNLKPGDNQAIDKIEELKKEMNELADKLMYDKLIASANKSFKEELYHEAMKDYFAAADIIPEDKFVSSRINEINQKLRTAESFDDLIAKEKYNEPSETKLKEKYPKERIAEVGQVLQQQLILVEKQSVVDVQHQSAEIAPTNKELEVHGVENDTELNNIYSQYINKANELFGNQQYIDSRGLYFKALDMKPDENYTKQRIDDINRLLKAIRTSPLDREYQKYVDLADSTFRENQYAVARGWYNRALGVKANEKYPIGQLKEIENKITQRMADQSGQQFDSNMQKAGKAYEEKNYNVARFWYKNALELRPDDADIKKRLDEIQNALK